MDAWEDPVGAFVPHGKVTRIAKNKGPLSGLTIAVKDLFDWKGVPTGAGNPTWLSSHPVPEHDAAVVAALFQAGATLHGKTITDELAYSIHGENVHYGTPQNTAAPGRVSGGSSSGSAAAVAAGLVDAALGTDTGGSVRVPASYCGIFGLRTTHGSVEKTGLVPLAPSFDTVGWFARLPSVLDDVAKVLLPASVEHDWNKVWTLPEAEVLTDAETRNGIGAVVRSLGYLTGSLNRLTEPYGGLEGLRKVYVTLQGWEAWQTHKHWIKEAKPVFGAAIDHRFLVASLVTDDDAEEAKATMLKFRADLRSALGTRGVLVLPSTAGPAPKIGEDETRVEAVRTRTMRLTALAGLAGLPQVSVPYHGMDGLPRGVGLLGGIDSDRALIALAARCQGA